MTAGGKSKCKENASHRRPAKRFWLDSHAPISGPASAIGWRVPQQQSILAAFAVQQILLFARTVDCAGKELSQEELIDLQAQYIPQSQV